MDAILRQEVQYLCSPSVYEVLLNLLLKQTTPFYREPPPFGAQLGANQNHYVHSPSTRSRPTNATYGSRSTFLQTSNVNQLSQLKAKNVHIF